MLWGWGTLGRWEMASRADCTARGSSKKMMMTLLRTWNLATLWRGTHHVISYGLPLLHVPPSNKAASSPRRGLVPTLKPQESSQDLREVDPHFNPMKGHKLTAKVNLSEQPRLAHTKM